MDFTPSRRTQAAAAPPVTSPRHETPTLVRRRFNIPAISRSTTRLIVIALIVGAGIYALAQLPHVTSKANPLPGATNSGQVTKANPDFHALTPPDKKVTWSRLEPPNSSSFYAFSDTIQGVTIRVSEQPLPDNLKDDPTTQLAQLARSYNANRTITANGSTVYIGATLKGQQSLLFTHGSLLIMITSDATLNDKQWTDYITALK